MTQSKKEKYAEAKNIYCHFSESFSNVLLKEEKCVIISMLYS